jgi:hypothetical protein
MKEVAPIGTTTLEYSAKKTHLKVGWEDDPWDAGDKRLQLMSGPNINTVK